jgi:hypothetical protein
MLLQVKVGHSAMSARCPVCPKAVDSDLINVRIGPLCGLKSDISRGQRSAKTGRKQVQQDARPKAFNLLDHLVGNGDQPWREGEPERVGDFEIDQQLELG